MNIYNCAYRHRPLGRIIALFALSILLAGCGGGGGGSSAVEDLMLSRMRSFGDGLRSRNTNRLMSNFSRSYLDTGFSYVDYRDTFDTFFRLGGQAWLEDLEAHEWSANNDYASRRFSAWAVLKLGGNVERTWTDRAEYFRRESGKWLIYGNQSNSRAPGNQVAFALAIRQMLEKDRSLPSPER